MTSKTLTVFTPTYNRAYCLGQTYQSLCRQNNKNFIWLIIDDGSTDNTADLVKLWIEENKIEIQYIYKENGGMHTGHNKAYEVITTPYNVCIDSDDYMPDNAVEIILKELAGLPETFAGLIGLDATQDGQIIGTIISDNLTSCKLNELYLKHGVTGDKKLVYRTSVVKAYPPYPTFSKEKFVPLDYKYLLIDQDYDLKPVNEVLCIVEYQSDGSTRNIFHQYKRNPRGFAFSRQSRIQYAATFKEKFKNAIHLVSCALLTNDFKLLKEIKKPVLVCLAFVPGVLLNFYIRYKTR